LTKGVHGGGGMKNAQEEEIMIKNFKQQMVVVLK
jgi:hypothetical protein